MDKIKSLVLEKVNFDPLKGEATIEIKVFDDRSKVITLDQLDPSKGDFVFRVYNNANRVSKPDIPLPYSELRTNPADRESLKSQPFAVPTITKNGTYKFQIVAIDNTSGQEISSKQVKLEVSGFPIAKTAGSSVIFESEQSAAPEVESTPVITKEFVDWIKQAVKKEASSSQQTSDINVTITWLSGLVDPDCIKPYVGEMQVTNGGKPLESEAIQKLNLQMKVTRSGTNVTGYTTAINKMMEEGNRHSTFKTNQGTYIIIIMPEELKKLYDNYGPHALLQPQIDKLRINAGLETNLMFGKIVKTSSQPDSSIVLKTQLQRTNVDDEIHYTKTLWDAIKQRIPDFRKFENLMNEILGTKPISPLISSGQSKQFTKQNLLQEITGRKEQFHPLPFTNIQAYRLLKSATQCFLWTINDLYNTDLNKYIASYDTSGDNTLTPYYHHIMERLVEWRNEIMMIESNSMSTLNYLGINYLPAIELIWSYWVEQGLMVQTINAVSMRFQNISTNPGTDPLAQIDIDPLRPLANLFWGYIQDEQHTLSIKRRAYEYDHTYGLQLEGRAVPVFKSVDSRSKFIEAFHNLLHSASIFFKESDDTTRVADAFVVLNNLREVHLLLAEGNHNAYGNLTWTARQEMMIQQYILSRPEMREFLGGRIMVPYRENWMDRVDRMRQIQNWGSTSITHYYDLAQHGEVLLLTIRAHDWSNEDDSIVAGSWAATFRNEIQRYIHSYRTVTGVDLSADAQLTDASFMQPSVLIQQRLMGEIRGPLRNGRIVGGNQPIRL